MTTACLPKITRFLTAPQCATRSLKSHAKKPLRRLIGWKSMPNTGLALLPLCHDTCHAQIGKCLQPGKYALPCVPPSMVKVKITDTRSYIGVQRASPYCADLSTIANARV